MLQCCVAVLCCSAVLQCCVVVCLSVCCVAVDTFVDMEGVAIRVVLAFRVAVLCCVCCSAVLQCVAVLCCSVLQCNVAVTNFCVDIVGISVRSGLSLSL